MRVGNILLIGAAGLGALAQVPNHLNKRAACNRDNLFRCFNDQRYSSQASDFCAELAPFTATVATAIATVTTTVETTITAEALEETEVHTTVFTETVPYTTVVVTAGAAAVKRQAAVNPPKCMTNGVTYPASRITSACSCIDMPVSTVSVTHVIGTETVTETNIIVTTPRATFISWESVSTTTTSGAYTVTVLPPGENRLINGDFETGDLTGWELSPVSWRGVLIQGTNSFKNWMCEIKIDGAEDHGILRHVKQVYLEAGNYYVGVWAPVAGFPNEITAWKNVVEYELVHLVHGTTIASKFSQSPKRVARRGRLAIELDHGFNVPETAQGYYQFSLKFLEKPPYGTNLFDGRSIDDLYLKRTS